MANARNRLSARMAFWERVEKNLSSLTLNKVNGLAVGLSSWSTIPMLIPKHPIGAVVAAEGELGEILAY